MLSTHAPCMRESQSAGARYTLTRRIAAIQLSPSDSRSTKMGRIVQLPLGAQVELCGDGYNDRTVKVRSEGTFYFVFFEDLKSMA